MINPSPELQSLGTDRCPEFYFGGGVVVPPLLFLPFFPPFLAFLLPVLPFAAFLLAFEALLLTFKNPAALGALPFGCAADSASKVRGDGLLEVPDAIGVDPRRASRMYSARGIIAPFQICARVEMGHPAA